MNKFVDAEMEEVKRLVEEKRKGIIYPKKDVITPIAPASETSNAVAKKPMNKFVKFLLYTVCGVAGIFILGVLYQILEFLAVAAILLIAWAGPRGRWWW